MALYYVAHRLFAAHDRALGAYIAHHLARRYGADTVFLPFCDTDEEHLVHRCKGRRLFELDTARLTDIEVMVAILHGPSLDDGVCMEIGFAAALGLPIVGVTTDFQVYGPTADGPLRCMLPDPLIQHLVGSLVAEPRLGSPRSSSLKPPAGSPDDRFLGFLRQNLTAINKATASAIEATDCRRRADTRLPSYQSRNSEPLAYLEPSPYANEDWVAKVNEALSAAGWNVYLASRLAAHHPGAASHHPDFLQRRALADWEALGRSSMAIVDIGGPETPPGSAAVIGACRATGRPVYAPHPRSWWTFAHGREPNYRNLMIQYGLTATFSHPTEVTAFASRALQSADAPTGEATAMPSV